MGIVRDITPIRLHEYLVEVDNDETRALELYAWNSRLSSECLTLIGHAEVLLRNRTDSIMKDYYDEAKTGLPWFLTNASELNQRDRDSIQEARGKLASQKKQETRDKIIAELTFGFWSNLFNTNHDELWRRCLHKVFRNDMDHKITRKEAAHLIDSIRITRNRVAHQNYLKHYDVPQAIKDIYTLADLISPEYKDWMQCNFNSWKAVYEACPEIDLDTMVIPGKVAWDIYKKCPIYVCRPERPFRDLEDIKYLAFYEHKSIRSQIPFIKHVYSRVPWTLDEAQLRLNSSDEFDRKLGKAMQWALSAEGVETARGWSHAQEGYRVFLLTPYREGKQGNDKHECLPNGDLPHTGDTAFVRNHRYTSLHKLIVAKTTDDLLD